jgi:putative DNA methylase
VATWLGVKCDGCGETFDVERFPARMAPDAPLVVAPGEAPFAAMDERGEYVCPHCGHRHSDRAARIKGTSVGLGGKAGKKNVELTLLMHPEWLAGCGPTDAQGRPLGGSADDGPGSTIRWYRERAKTLRLLEVRGLVAIEKTTKRGETKVEHAVPPIVTCPETGVTFSTDKDGGNVPRTSTFECREGTCGRQQDVLESIKATGTTGPKAPYVIQAHSPARDQKGYPYGGRFFAAATDTRRYESAAREWDIRKEEDLRDWWPRSEIPFGFMTHLNNGGIPNHGYTHWWKMFNPLQLLINSQLLKAISARKEFSEASREAVLGAFQQFLRNQNLFCIWDISRDCLAPALSSSNFHPKASPVENNVFHSLGRGNWESSTAGVVEGLAWRQATYELVSKRLLDREHSDLAHEITGKSEAIHTGDSTLDVVELACQSASALDQLLADSYDLVVTDPPFGGLAQNLAGTEALRLF